MVTADGSLEAVHGYVVKTEAFGTLGMARVGESSPINLAHHSRSDSTHPRPHWFVDVFGAANTTAELAHFVARVHGKGAPESTGEDGRAALMLRSVERRRPVRDEIKP